MHVYKHTYTHTYISGCYSNCLCRDESCFFLFCYFSDMEIISSRITGASVPPKIEHGVMNPTTGYPMPHKLHTVIIQLGNLWTGSTCVALVHVS